MGNTHSHQHAKRKTVLMGSMHKTSIEVELLELYSQVLASFRSKTNQPDDGSELVTYTSQDSQLIMYLFDQESYQKFKDFAFVIPESVPVKLNYHNGIPKEKISGKVLVVKSAVNGKIHEVPILAGWCWMKDNIDIKIPKYFFPCQLVYKAPGHHLQMHDQDSWTQFFAFVKKEEYRDQRYFEVSAGKGSIEEQIFKCRQEYVNLVLPLMRQHQAVFLDQSLAPEVKQEKMFELTQQMAKMKSGSTRHSDLEEQLRLVLNRPGANTEHARWRKLYDLEHTFFKEVDEGDYNGNGTYYSEKFVRYYNTDSTEMLPILEQELLVKEYQH